MRKFHLSLLLLTLAFLTAGTCAKKPKAPTKTELLTAAPWYGFEYRYYENHVLEDREPADYLTLEFHTDGTYRGMDEDEPFSGRWQWEDNETAIHFYDTEENDDFVLKVDRLDESVLILYDEYEDFDDDDGEDVLCRDEIEFRHR